MTGNQLSSNIWHHWQQAAPADIAPNLIQCFNHTTKVKHLASLAAGIKHLTLCPTKWFNLTSNITHLASLTTSDSIWQLASEKCLFTAFSRGTDMLSQKLPHRTCKQKADHGAPIGAISWHVRKILTVIKTVPGTDLLKMSSFDMFEHYKTSRLLLKMQMFKMKQITESEVSCQVVSCQVLKWRDWTWHMVSWSHQPADAQCLPRPARASSKQKTLS